MILVKGLTGRLLSGGATPVWRPFCSDRYRPDPRCDDTNASVHPAAMELTGDEVDSDCDGTETCFVDWDDDGAETCFVDADGWVAREECDDSDALVNPDADEVCDEVDNDCDGTDPASHPGAVEVEDDGVDQDCDGEDAVSVDEGADTGGADTSGADTIGDAAGDKCGCGASSALGSVWLPLLSLTLVGWRRRVGLDSGAPSP